MGSYQIEWKRSTKKDLRRIPSANIIRIVEAVELLSSNPYPVGSTKLTGSDLVYRIRVGDYRIIYEIYNDRLIVEVVRIGHRRDVYR